MELSTHKKILLIFKSNQYDLMGKKDNAIENYLLWFLNLLKVIFGTFFLSKILIVINLTILEQNKSCN